MVAWIGILLTYAVVRYAYATECGSDEFPCNDGTCVLKSRWCDSIEDCWDYSDEYYCSKNTVLFTNRNHCNDSFFICKDGPCIPLAGRCDGYTSCDDGSDEANCDTTTHITKDYHEAENSTVYSRTSVVAETTVKNGQSSLYDVPFDAAITDFEVETELAHRDAYTTDHTMYKNFSLGTTGMFQTSSRYADAQTAISTQNKVVNDIPQADTVARKTEFVKAQDITKGFRKLATRDFMSRRDLLHERLLSVRDKEYGWGEETSRAVTALYISDYFTKKETEENLLMSKQLHLKLSLALIRNETRKMDLSELSLYINALLASCDEPRNFHGYDLIATLRYRTNIAHESAEFVNPAVYLTLCLSNETTYRDAQKIGDVLKSNRPETDKIGIKALAALAASCFSDIPMFSNSRLGLDYARRIYETVARNGLPENIYDLALTVQALNDAGINEDLWNRSEAMNKIVRWQNQDDSRSDILAAYYVLPILSAKSLRSLSSHCHQDYDMKVTPVDVLMNDRGHKIPVTYSLYFGEHVEVSQSLRTRVSMSANLLDLMRIAERENPIYRFKFDMTRGKPSVYSIGGIANDAEQGLYWVLHVSPRNLTGGANQKNLVTFDGDIRSYLLQQSDHIVFWLKKVH